MTISKYLSGCGALRLMRASDHFGGCGQSEHYCGEKHVSCERTAEEWQSGSVASHQSGHGFWIHAPGCPDGEITENEERDGTGQRGSADPQPIGVFAQTRAEQENRRIPGPNHQLIPGEWIGVHEFGEDDVGSGEQRKWHP